MTILEWLSDHLFNILLAGCIIALFFLIDVGRSLRKKHYRMLAEDAEREMFLRSYQYKTPPRDRDDRDTR
jgi:hypothetical protein